MNFKRRIISAALCFVLLIAFIGNNCISADVAADLNDEGQESAQTDDFRMQEMASGEKIILPEAGSDAGELLVVFREGVTAGEAENILAGAAAPDPGERPEEASVEPESVETEETGVEQENDETTEGVLSTFSAVEEDPDAGPSQLIYSALISGEMTYLKAAEHIASYDEVAYVQPNFLYFEQDDQYVDVGTNDPEMSYGGNWQLAALHVPEAWKVQKTNGAVRVAVMDTGCDLLHEDLSANIDTAYAYQSVNTDTYDLKSGGKTYRFASRTAGPLTTSWGTRGDLGTHGTHVCGIIGAEPDNGVGIAGISYNAKLVPINVFNTATIVESGGSVRVATTKTVTAAYQHLFSLLENGELSDLKVINLSLGGYDAAANDKLLSNAITRAKNEFDIVTVCAGGNNGVNNNYYEDGKIRYSYPADFDSSVSVCALDMDGWRTSPVRSISSDFNDAKDITAPGGVINSTYPMDEYYAQSGTSMAAPCISGILALIFAANPSLSVENAVDILYSTATDITGNANNAFDSEAVCGTGKDIYTGWGLANAEAAVRKAKGLARKPIPVTDLLLSDYDLTMLPDKTVGLTCIVTPWDADDKTVQWTSSNEKIISVDENGVASAHTMGTAQITAEAGGVQAVCNVRVLFRDVTNPNLAAYDAIYWGTDRNYVYGYGKYFDIDANVTRAQAILFLWRAAGRPAPKSQVLKFKDADEIEALAPDYKKAILWGTEKGIIMGFTSGEKKGMFKPNDNCTRGQIMTFFWRYSGKPAAKPGAKTFPDVPSTHLYYDAIMWGSSYKITTGFSADGTFRPGAYCTRGQCVTFIYRMFY